MGKYIATAFANLEFAYKLWNYAENGNVDINELDVPLTIAEGRMIFVLKERLFEDPNDLLLAFQNNLTIAFGAAAITLNKTREELKINLPHIIESEADQFVALAYQIRNAFAHDIAEPRWVMTNQKYLRTYQFDGVDVDLTLRNEEVFEYAHIGGPETLRLMYQYGIRNLGFPPEYS